MIKNILEEVSYITEDVKIKKGDLLYDADLNMYQIMGFENGSEETVELYEASQGEMYYINIKDIKKSNATIYLGKNIE